MKRFDLPLFSLVLLLTFFGLFMIYDASSVMGNALFEDKYHFIKVQLLWVLLGYISLFIFYLIDYRKLYNFALPSLIGSLVLLFLVFIPGVGSAAKGASRWVNIGSFKLQPSEFIKLSLAIYLSAWFSNKEKERFLAFAFLMSAVLLLVMLQPDMGTASIILFEAVAIYFFSGGNLIHFLIAGPIVGLLGYLLIMIEPYRMNRLTAFLNLDNSFNNTSYHVKQILIALGAGGISVN